jgi:hypothetical protein
MRDREDRETENVEKGRQWITGKTTKTKTEIQTDRHERKERQRDLEQ